ncbi:uncharacterized protein [Montipora capricornis]|uniref:uncharacterized protein isoform X1 n=1 Tax=Montipora capricornis TaxID=246305 RepID=UPI0035F1C173
MEFKGFLLCFAFFFVVASGATVCKCGEEQKKKSVSEFAVKLNDGRKEIDEKITVDTENETETFHLEDDDTGNIHEVLFDFRRVMRGLAQEYICNLLHIKNPSTYGLRYNSEVLLVLPSMKRKRHLVTGLSLLLHHHSGISRRVQ